MSASPQNIGATIAFLRKRKGITQRVLADSLNVTDKAVSRWERGIGIPDQSLLVKLADVLGVDVESILAGEHASVADDWRGVLLLEYPNGMGPETMLFDRPALELQLGYLMLTGLRDIAIVGRGSHLEAARRVVAQLPELGVAVSFVDAGAADSFSKEHGTVLVDGIDFLYGKDLTRALWRFMTECKAPSRVVSHTGTQLHMSFLPAGTTVTASAQTQKLCRGVVAFPIAGAQDALDASTLISILSRQQGEPFMDLPSISRARGFSV